MEEVKMKKCSKCKKEKQLNEDNFYKSNKSKNGFRSVCRICEKEYQKKYREKNKQNKYKVYKITNNINDKIYIGMTRRKLEHRWNNGKGYKDNIVFYKDIQKYSWDNFNRETIQSNLTKEDAEKLEIQLIEKYDTTNPDKGYNLDKGGICGLHSEQTKKKISRVKMGVMVRGEHPMAKKVYCDNKIFECATDFAEFYNINYAMATQWLSGLQGTPKKFIDLNLHYINEEYKVIPSNIHTHNAKKVICDGIIYNSITKCANYYNVERRTMANWLNGNSKMPKKFVNLNLRFSEDNVKIINIKKRKVICDEIIFNNIKDCADYYRINKSTMRAWLSGQNNMPQKFKDIGLQYYIEEDVVN